MPAPAGGFTVFFECRPAQSLMSLRPFADSAVADRSGWHSARCIGAPGTWIAAMFAHGAGRRGGGGSREPGRDEHGNEGQQQQPAAGHGVPLLRSSDHRPCATSGDHRGDAPTPVEPASHLRRRIRADASPARSGAVVPAGRARRTQGVGTWAERRSRRGVRRARGVARPPATCGGDVPHGTRSLMRATTVADARARERSTWSRSCRGSVRTVGRRPSTGGST